MTGNKRSIHHLNRYTTKNEIHDIYHFLESKVLLFHTYDNWRHPNDQMTEGQYGPHTEWGMESKEIMILSPGDFDER